MTLYRHEIDRIEFLFRYVIGCQYYFDTGQFFSFGGINRQDPGVRVTAAQQLSVQHARQCYVYRVTAPAHDFIQGVDVADICAYIC